MYFFGISTVYIEEIICYRHPNYKHFAGKIPIEYEKDKAKRFRKKHDRRKSSVKSIYQLTQICGGTAFFRYVDELGKVYTFGTGNALSEYEAGAMRPKAKEQQLDKDGDVIKVIKYGITCDIQPSTFITPKKAAGPTTTAAMSAPPPGLATTSSPSPGHTPTSEPSPGLATIAGMSAAPPGLATTSSPSPGLAIIADMSTTPPRLATIADLSTTPPRIATSASPGPATIADMPVSLSGLASTSLSSSSGLAITTAMYATPPGLPTTSAMSAPYNLASETFPPDLLSLAANMSGINDLTYDPSNIEIIFPENDVIITPFSTSSSYIQEAMYPATENPQIALATHHIVEPSPSMQDVSVSVAPTAPSPQEEAFTLKQSAGSSAEPNAKPVAMPGAEIHVEQSVEPKPKATRKRGRPAKLAQTPTSQKTKKNVKELVKEKLKKCRKETATCVQPQCCNKDGMFIKNLFNYWF